MKYLLAALYGIIGVMFFYSAIFHNRAEKGKGKDKVVFYKAYDKKVRKIVPVLVRLTNVLLGICMAGFCTASALMPQAGNGEYAKYAGISNNLFIISAYALLVPIGIVVITWIWMQFHRKKR